MKKGQIVFTGHFLEYFFMMLALMVLTAITCGIALPYLFYWSHKYFFTHMEVHIEEK